MTSPKSAHDDPRSRSAAKRKKGVRLLVVPGRPTDEQQHQTKTQFLHHALMRLGGGVFQRATRRTKKTDSEGLLLKMANGDF
jgi:hypothetical protein